MKTRRKKTFTLFEVLLAIAIVAIAAPLLFSLPFRLAKREINGLYECELSRLADQEYHKTRLSFLQGEIEETSLTKSDGKPILLEEKPVSIAFSDKHKRSFVMKKQLVLRKKKNLPASKEGWLLEVKISFLNPNKKLLSSFSYQFARKTDSPA